MRTQQSRSSVFRRIDLPMADPRVMISNDRPTGKIHCEDLCSRSIPRIDRASFEDDDWRSKRGSRNGRPDELQTPIRPSSIIVSSLAKKLKNSERERREICGKRRALLVRCNPFCCTQNITCQKTKFKFAIAVLDEMPNQSDSMSVFSDFKMTQGCFSMMPDRRTFRGRIAKQPLPPIEAVLTEYLQGTALHPVTVFTQASPQESLSQEFHGELSAPLAPRERFRNVPKIHRR